MHPFILHPQLGFATGFVERRRVFNRSEAINVGLAAADDAEPHPNPMMEELRAYFETEVEKGEYFSITKRDELTNNQVATAGVTALQQIFLDAGIFERAEAALMVSNSEFRKNLEGIKANGDRSLFRASLDAFDDSGLYKQADGDYGHSTRLAVAFFQFEHDLKIDGAFGRGSFERLQLDDLQAKIKDAEGDKLARLEQLHSAVDSIAPTGGQAAEQATRAPYGVGDTVIQRGYQKGLRYYQSPDALQKGHLENWWDYGVEGTVLDDMSPGAGGYVKVRFANRDGDEVEGYVYKRKATGEQILEKVEAEDPPLIRADTTTIKREPARSDETLERIQSDAQQFRGFLLSRLEIVQVIWDDAEVFAENLHANISEDKGLIRTLIAESDLDNILRSLNTETTRDSYLAIMNFPDQLALIDWQLAEIKAGTEELDESVKSELIAEIEAQATETKETIADAFTAFWREVQLKLQAESEGSPDQDGANTADSESAPPLMAGDVLDADEEFTSNYPALAAQTAHTWFNFDDEKPQLNAIEFKRGATITAGTLELLKEAFPAANSIIDILLLADEAVWSKIALLKLDNRGDGLQVSIEDTEGNIITNSDYYSAVDTVGLFIREHFVIPTEPIADVRVLDMLLPFRGTSITESEGGGYAISLPELWHEDDISIPSGDSDIEPLPITGIDITQDLLRIPRRFGPGSINDHDHFAVYLIERNHLSDNPDKAFFDHIANWMNSSYGVLKNSEKVVLLFNRLRKGSEQFIEEDLEELWKQAKPMISELYQAPEEQEQLLLGIDYYLAETTAGAIDYEAETTGGNLLLGVGKTRFTNRDYEGWVDDDGTVTPGWSGVKRWAFRQERRVPGFNAWFREKLEELKIELQEEPDEEAASADTGAAADAPFDLNNTEALEEIFGDRAETIQRIRENYRQVEEKMKMSAKEAIAEITVEQAQAILFAWESGDRLNTMRENGLGSLAEELAGRLQNAEQVLDSLLDQSEEVSQERLSEARKAWLQEIDQMFAEVYEHVHTQLEKKGTAANSE